MVQVVDPPRLNEVFYRISFDKINGRWDVEELVWDGDKMDYKGIKHYEELVGHSVDYFTQLRLAGDKEDVERYGRIQGKIWIRKHV